MVLKGKNSFSISCNCGCGNTATFKVYDDVVVVSFLSSDFYNKQFSLTYSLDRKLKEILSIKYNKPFILSDIVISNEDLDDFISALESLKIEKDVENTKNTGFLYLDTNDMEECQCFELMLINKTSLIDSITLKTYRAYDIVLNKKSYEAFVKKCKQKLKKGDAK